MSEMIVKLTWDGDDLGPNWMNPDNLALLLYSEKFAIKPELLKIDVIDHTEWRAEVPEETEAVSVAREVMKLIKRELRKVS